METNSYIDFISAGESHYKALMDKNALTMKIYMGASVGVGEHPQVFEEFLSSLEAYKDARDSFEVIQQMKAQYIAQAETDEDSKSETADESKD